ncbi:unnamed protein product [Echinostoma caproni]|uniref:DOCKER domain-containing protein n=1 Tax=Echinostoma caproni TaxID=27848 RepID=A0A183AZ84_9TREM|nr:unnamed protein product [Echinostoma caproni]
MPLLSHITRKVFQLICTYIRLFLEYGSQVVDSWFLIRDRDALERVQRAATKAVVGMQYLAYPERLIELDLYAMNKTRFPVLSETEKTSSVYVQSNDPSLVLDSDKQISEQRVARIIEN